MPDQPVIERPSEGVSSALTHVDATGAAHMVDVGHKPVSDRFAVASGHIRMQRETFNAIQGNTLKKGDVTQVARLAGIQAAKKTADLIPLCHPVTLSGVLISINLEESLPGVRVEGRVSTTGQTGVEMEALTAVTVALLTVYDMVKAMDRTMEISHVVLREKRGGTRGDYLADP